MKKILALLLACSICAVGQAPAAKPVASAPAASSPAGQASRQEVTELLTVLKARQQMETMLEGFKEQMKRGQLQGFELGLAKNGIKLSEQDRQRAQVRLDAIADEALKEMPYDELLASSAEVYRKHFSSQDIAALLVFYRSPAGQKFLAEMPSLTQESMRAGGEVMTKHIPEIMQRVQTRMDELHDEFSKQPPAVETKKQ